MLRGRLHSSKRCFYGTKWCQWTKGKGPLLDMWRYVWRKSPIILRLSFWMILDSKTCLCQMSDHEKSLIIHEQCLWNRPFCQVITNLTVFCFSIAVSFYVVIFRSIQSSNNHWVVRLMHMLKWPELFHIFLSLDQRLINALSFPDQCLIIAWSMLFQCLINAFSMLNHRLIIRLLLSLSCSVSLWFESAQRSLERNIVSCELGSPWQW